MSFSSDLKNELFNQFPKSIHCRMALLAGYISVNGRVEGDNLAIRVDSDVSEEYILKLVRMCTKIPDANVICTNEKKHHRKVIITGSENVSEIYTKLKLKKTESRLLVDNIITQKNCCKRTYFTGAFLAGGSIGSPEKSYQMEIPTLFESEAEKLTDVLKSLELKSSIVNHRDRYVVYIKDGDTIADALGMMGASGSLMEFENIRILKGIRNDVNREVNCDTANMAKIAKSSAKQIEDIEYIQNNAGLDSLQDGLREVAETRLEYPYLSLKELGEICEPPLGKSAISHRLRKLSEIANQLRN